MADGTVTDGIMTLTLTPKLSFFQGGREGPPIMVDLRVSPHVAGVHHYLPVDTLIT